MNHKEFKHILDRYAKGQLSEAESQELENWLDTMEDKDAFDTLSAGELSKDKTEGYLRLQKRIDNEVPDKVYRLLSRRLQVAAAVIVLVIALLYRDSILNMVVPHRTVYASSRAGDIKKIILSDGSIVWLKGNSQLTWPRYFDGANREVTIEGEALFEVAKDPKHPFLLHSGSLVTRVLGTSFNIRHNNRETVVYVLTGAVSLSGPQTVGKVLYAHENAVYSEKKATVEKAAATRTVHEITKGTEYDMAFNDVAMGEVIKRIEQKFEVSVQVADPATLHNLITADVTDQSLQHTMEMICQALNLQVDINGKTVLLQPKK